MDNRKYKIMNRIHDSTPLSPATMSSIYADTKQINENRKALMELIELKWVVKSTGSDILKLLPQGLSALEAEQEQRQFRKSQSVRYWVTTAIALIALAISIISLLSQLGLLQLPRY